MGNKNELFQLLKNSKLPRFRRALCPPQTPAAPPRRPPRLAARSAHRARGPGPRGPGKASPRLQEPRWRPPAHALRSGPRLPGRRAGHPSGRSPTTRGQRPAPWATAPLRTAQRARPRRLYSLPMAAAGRPTGHGGSARSPPGPPAGPLRRCRRGLAAARRLRLRSRGPRAARVAPPLGPGPGRQRRRPPRGRAATGAAVRVRRRDPEPPEPAAAPAFPLRARVRVRRRAGVVSVTATRGQVRARCQEHRPVPS